MQKYQNITNPKTERGHYMNRTNLPSIQMASRKVERRTSSLSLTTEAAAKRVSGGRGVLVLKRTPLSRVAMLTLRALMVAMGENRSKTDIELALIRKAESENTINSDTNKQGNAWARTQLP